MDSGIVVLLIHITIFVFSVFQLFVCSSVVVDSKSITVSRASSTRSQSLERSKLTSTSPPVPLLAGVGTYYLTLSLGTPPQPLPFSIDTGSSLVWSPCRANFTTCSDCNDSTGSGVGNIKPFIPENSSSYVLATCDSTQCKLLYSNLTMCRSVENLYCLEYDDSRYMSWETKGSLMSESLTFPDETRLDKFAVGCSDYAYGARSGIAGFGRAPYSLPSQMELDSFSYCLVSHEFDDNRTISSDLVLNKKGDAGSNGSSAPTGGGIVQYTPFIDNPIFSPDYYYVWLQNITVGNVTFVVPDEHQIPINANGDGGTIVDSGTSFTVMKESVFDLVAKEFKNQIIGKNSTSNSRNTKAENATRLGLCFNVWSSDDIPTLSLHFQGAVMNLPRQNYFVDIGYSVFCTLMINSSREIGPAIILGNYLQQDFYVEFDIKQNRLGFLNYTCHA